jgi:transposase
VVIEVDRPNRQVRRRNGKSDELDAIQAARAASSGRAIGVAKSAGGDVEAIRVLLVARPFGPQCAYRLGFAAPELRARLRVVPTDQLGRIAAVLCPTAGSETVGYATKLHLGGVSAWIKLPGLPMRGGDARRG